MVYQPTWYSTTSQLTAILDRSEDHKHTLYRFDIINLIIVSAIYLYLLSIKLHSNNYHIQVIDVRSCAYGFRTSHIKPSINLFVGDYNQ